MSVTSLGILRKRLLATPVAVIDFETTGTRPGYDRAVELAVVRIDPGSKPRLVFDTLINPRRAVAATFIHGITDRDVRDAPRFEDIVHELLRVLSGCVIAAHNAYFDMSFLRFELGRLTRIADPPFVCTRYSRPLIGRSADSLEKSCLADRIKYQPAHTSKSDAIAAALLWQRYQREFADLGLVTFECLTTSGRDYKFFQSFGNSPIYSPRSSVASSRLKPRA